MVVIHKVATWHFGFLFFRTDIHVNFGTRTTRTLVTHFPKVIFFISEKYMVFSNPFFPYIIGFLVKRYAVFFTAFKNGYIEVFFGNFVYFGEQFPRPANGFFFEVIAKRPVAKHLKHRVVIRVATYLFQIVVLPRYAQTLLSIGYAFVFRFSITKEELFKLVHTSVGKHQGRVVFNHHRSRGNNSVPFAFKEF